MSLVKKDQKDFSTTEIKENVRKQKLIIDIYHQSEILIKKLKISEQNISYYAELAEFYTIQKLKSFRTKNKARLYLLCYVQMRLKKINDQLISSFIYKVQQYLKVGEDYQRSKIDISEAVDKNLRKRAHQVLKININEKIPDIAVRETAFQVVPKSEYKKFLADFRKPNYDREFYRWEMYGKLGKRMKQNLRPIFMSMEFNCDDGLTQAITFLKQHIVSTKSFKSYSIEDIPLSFFPKAHKKYLLTKPIIKASKNIGVIDGDRYEFMLYLQLQKRICGIDAFVKHSNSYRALEDELIDLEYWTTNKEKILRELNMPMFSKSIVDIVNDLETSIEEQYREVNHNIHNGTNTSIKLKYNKKRELTHWTLPYNPVSNGVNNHFFKNLPTMNIADIAKCVNQNTNYSNVFTHIQPKYSKLEKPATEVLNACIIANATGIEIKKMIDISDIAEYQLTGTNKNFIRVQTLRQANDVIINQTAKLPIFKEYNLSDYGVHASIDGQKLLTKHNTIKARHSKKYFGTRKGIVIVTVNANNIPISTG